MDDSLVVGLSEVALFEFALQFPRALLVCSPGCGMRFCLRLPVSVHTCALSLYSEGVTTRTGVGSSGAPFRVRFSLTRVSEQLAGKEGGGAHGNLVFLHVLAQLLDLLLHLLPQHLRLLQPRLMRFSLPRLLLCLAAQPLCLLEVCLCLLLHSTGSLG